MGSHFYNNANNLEQIMAGGLNTGDTASLEIPATLLASLEKEGRRQRKSVARILAEMLEAREIERLRSQPTRAWRDIKKELDRT